MSDYESSIELSISSASLSTSSDSCEIATADVACPYLFEPVLSSDNEEDSDGVVSPDRYELLNRLDNTNWCTCERCQSLETAVECRCCQEIEAVRAKMEESPHDITCITEHPGFSEVCLSIYALETAYYHYRQEHGREELHAEQVHRKYRYTAYRQLVRWCWRFLGRKVRVPLPACAVWKIRERFPSEEFVGFSYPKLD